MFKFFNTSTCLFFQVLKNSIRNTCPAWLFFSKCVIWRALPTRFFYHNFFFSLSLSLSLYIYIYIYIYMYIYIFNSFFPQSAGFFLLLLLIAPFLFSIQTSRGLAKNKKTFVIVCVLINLIFSFVNTLLSFLK